MRKAPAKFLFLALLTCAPCFAQAPTYYPRNIQFKGVPDYTREELLAAAHLKSEDELTVPEMSARGKFLMETGLFSKLTYTFDGINLIFHIEPSPDLLPVKIVNLPLPTGKELDAQLRARLPLYRGRIPGSGGLCEQVRATLEQMLAEQGLKATVQNEAIAGSGPDKTPAMNFSIADPPVKVGAITINGGSARDVDIYFGKRLAKISGASFDTAATPAQIRAAVARYYAEQAYVDAGIDLHVLPSIANPDSIAIPFDAIVTPGKQYTLTGIQLAPGLLLTQAEMDTLIHERPGNLADARHVQRPLAVLEQRYHRQGQVAAKIQATPTFDRAAATVHYRVAVEPGLVYKMGKLDLSQIQPELATGILKAWKLKPGVVFDESAIIQLLAIGDANPLLSQTFQSVELRYTLTLNDEDRTVDVLLRLIRRGDDE
jgi:outer membrane protein assembly factor BamA